MAAPSLCPPQHLPEHMFYSSPNLGAGEPHVDRSVSEQLSIRFGDYSAPTSEPRFRFIDLFAGIGGFRLAMEAVGGECVFTCEIDKFCQQTYEANFPLGDPIRGDIRDVHSDEIPDFDVLVAGFPCQPFSIAGVSKKRALGQPEGFACDTQGTLFFEIERILEARKPAAFVLENVRNLVSHDRGNTFRTIRAVLEDKLDYQIDCSIVDASHWLPQHRERIFIVGFREDTGFTFNDLVIPSPPQPTMKSILHPEDGSEEADDRYTTGAKGAVDKKYVLSQHLWKYLQAYARRHRAKGNGFGFGLVGPDDQSRTLSARYYKDGSEILVKRGAKGRARPRRLTPRECSRLMGFDGPDKGEFQIPVSDTQAYRQFGNAVAVPAATAVARLVAGHLYDVPAIDPRIHRIEEPRLAWT